MSNIIIELIIKNEDPLSENYFVRILFVILLILCQANYNDREVLCKQSNYFILTQKV